jgi:DNA-binding Lrp family transcriptional regulator
MPFTKLATAVGLSEAAVRQRVQRLLDGDVMQVVAVTNPLWLAGRRMAMIGVKVHGPVEDLAAEIEQLEGVEYLVVTAGSFDLLCEAVVADDAALLELTNRLRSSRAWPPPRRSSTSTWSSRRSSGAPAEPNRDAPADRVQLSRFAMTCLTRV